MPVRFHFDFDKALACVAYLASCPAVKDPDKYKICKLVFLADKSHLVRFSRPITGDRICAMEYGPVPSEVLDLLNALLSGETTNPRVTEMDNLISIDRRYATPHFGLKRAVDFEEVLSLSDLAALKQVATEYGAKSFDELKALTHEMVAYKKAWVPGRPNNAPMMAFEDLFEEDETARTGALDEMLEDDLLRTAFGGKVV